MGRSSSFLIPPARPDRTETFLLGEQTVSLKAWQGLHFKKLHALVGMVLRVEFLRPDGTPRYKRPMWLFWTGPETAALSELCRMYLWRFAIEHLFRFLKQHMGLNANQSTDLVSTDQWMWFCAIAYWQLLLMRDEIPNARPAWYPAAIGSWRKKMTPGQVQRGALCFLVQLGTPAQTTRTAGKGKGRSKGYHPAPRQRFQVVKKGKVASESGPKRTLSADFWFLLRFLRFERFLRYLRISKVKLCRKVTFLTNFTNQDKSGR